MSKWEMAQLGSLTKIKTGKLDANVSSQNGIYPFFTCSKKPLKISSYSYDCECVLVAGNGDLNVKYYNGKFDAYQRTYIIESINNRKLFVPYLFTFLRKYVETLREQSIGGVIKYIKLGNLTNAIIPLPPLETQYQIAKTLSIAAELLTMRKQQLAELDNLIKSTFYDMFGDPVTNEKGWVLKPIGHFSTVKIGPFGSLLHAGDYIEGGFPLVNPSHIIDGKIVPDIKLTLSSVKFEELQSYTMKKGDIVVGRRGEIGRCAIVDDAGLLCGTGSMFIRIEKDYLPMMLQRIISSVTIRAKLEHHAVGVTMKNLNSGTISNLEVPMVPIPLQIRFFEFVSKIEQQKALVKKAIDETQHLFDSLMSEYFE